MSYILEALKKSESERNQGRVPDLGQQMRMIHGNRKRGIPAVAWLTLALLVNAAVLAALFWPGYGLWSQGREAVTAVPVAAGQASPEPVGAETDTVREPPGTIAGEVARSQSMAEPADMTAASGAIVDEVDAAPEPFSEAPTVIVPTVRAPLPPGESAEPWQGRVPHLVELPMAFQRQVPDLVFNSHVYSDDPRSRSVMINNRFLRMGETLGPLRVELITQEGVELSMDGQRFRVGVVRDWSSPR